MNRFFYSFLVLICLMFLQTSCTVQDHQVPGQSSCLIVTSIEKKTDPEFPFDEEVTWNGKSYPINKISKTTYEYDNQQRIKKTSRRVFDHPGFGADYDYQYFPNKLIELFTTEGTSDASSREITLNDKGYNVTDGLYQYDADGYLIEIGRGNPLASSKFTITNGNVTQREVFNKQERWIYDYEYDYSKPSLPVIYQFEGKPSKNLVNKVTIRNWFGSAAPTITVQTFLYTFDTQGRVIRMQKNSEFTLPNSSSPPTTWIEIQEFSYECR